MKSHFAVSHFSVNFALRGKGCNRVNDYYIDCPRTDKVVGNFECLFSIVGLGNVEIIYIDAQFLCIVAVKSVFGINKGC